jgi:5-methyltetrahydropteroyltriglutamate--homocysteine methyltransferase
VSAIDRFRPAARFDGGNLDCGNGLLLQIRRHIDPLESGQLLEIRSTEPSVAEDLPSWCRLTGNELVSTWHDRAAGSWSFLISKHRFDPVAAEAVAAGLPGSAAETKTTSPVNAGWTRRVVPEIAPLSVMGIGSWPRPD